MNLEKDWLVLLGWLLIVMLYLGINFVGCRPVTPPIRDGVYLESCWFEQYVRADSELSENEKILRLKMARNNRILVGAEDLCIGVGK